MTETVFDQICDQAFGEYPLEMCGLIAGMVDDDGALAVRYYRCRNLAQSAKLYTLDPGEHLRAELDAEAQDWEVLGVVHSHTHSEPFPSPTDIAQAPDPGWHYVIVSLKRDAPELRSYRIVDNRVEEEPVRLQNDQSA